MVFFYSALRQVFWDIRNDSDALFHHYHVSLAGCRDLQILDLCVRRSRFRSTHFVGGLATALNIFGVSTFHSANIKNAGSRLFAPEKGGSYQVFETRPLHPTLIEYKSGCR
ncbi:hypothetical protein DL96DRAFT_1631531 [Flagelloscypha sp. PMI_526]|nr:hypothetical protein DL96DRAFT_1631531 [Flagelloscypha sp. PMI_526]